MMKNVYRHVGAFVVVVVVVIAVVVDIAVVTMLLFVVTGHALAPSSVT